MKLKVFTLLLLSLLFVNVPAWANLTKTEVSQLYVSIFGRASEGSGNAYWQTQADMSVAADAMLDTQAAKDYFGTNLETNQAFIEHIYHNTLNKTISDDLDEISYWVDMLHTGTTRGEAVAALVGAIKNYAPDGPYYDPNDAATVAAYNQFMHRVTVSDSMADNVYDPPDNWETLTSFNHGMVVTDDPATVFAAMAVVNGFVQTPEWKEFETAVNVDVDALGGQDATVIYQGKTQSGAIQVPANELMGVIIDGKAYLYHPTMGEDVTFFETTSRQALALFVFGLDYSDVSAPDNPFIFSQTAPEPKILGPGDDTIDDTGVWISRLERETNTGEMILNAENRYNRWVGLKFSDGSTRMLPPSGRIFDSNICRWLSGTEYSWLVQEVWPDDDNPYAHFASTDRAVIETAATGDVYIVGATWRASPYNWYTGRSAPNLAEARAMGKFYELVNILDIYYVFVEGIKSFGGAAIPLECIDIAFLSLANWYEANALSIASGDVSIRHHFNEVMEEDFYNSLVNCSGVLTTNGVYEIIQTLIDLVAFFDWFYEDLRLSDAQQLNLPAYGKIHLKGDTPADPDTENNFTCRIVHPSEGEHITVETGVGRDVAFIRDELFCARVFKDGVDITSALEWQSDRWRTRGKFMIKTAEGEWKKAHSGFVYLREDGLAGTSSHQFQHGFFQLFGEQSNQDVQIFASEVRFDYEIWYDAEYYDVSIDAEPFEGSCSVDVHLCDENLGPCPE